MSLQTRFAAVAISAACMGAAFASSGTHIFVPNNTVVPIRFDDQLDVHENRPGDRFFVKVDNDRDFPRGTRLEGRVLDMHQRDGDQPAYMDLEFVRVLLPDGTRAPIRAVPIKMDKNITRRPDGRYEASGKIVRKENYVLGGAVGGLVIGQLMKKPFEGAMVGTIAGIVAAETNKHAGEELTIKRGDRMGAYIERDFQTDSRANYGHYYDRGNDRYRDNGDYDEPRISFRDRELRYGDDQSPYRLDDTIMVPLERTAAQMDLNVEHANGGVVIIESDDAMMRVEPDSTRYRLNGKRGTLPRAVVNKRGILYIPIEAFSMMRIGRIAVNGTTVEG